MVGYSAILVFMYSRRGVLLAWSIYCVTCELIKRNESNVGNIDHPIIVCNSFCMLLFCYVIIWCNFVMKSVTLKALCIPCLYPKLIVDQGWFMIHSTWSAYTLFLQNPEHGQMFEPFESLALFKSGHFFLFFHQNQLHIK